MVKNPPASTGGMPWARKIPWRRESQPTPVFLLGKSHGQRSLVGYSSWSHKRVCYNLATKQTTIFSIKMASLGLTDELN